MTQLCEHLLRSQQNVIVLDISSILLLDGGYCDAHFF